MYMVLFVLDDPIHLDRLLESFSKLGVSGVTILDSSGLHRHQSKRIPMRYTYADQTMQESGNVTLITIVPDETVANECLAAIEHIVGDLDGPNTGVFSAWPLSVVKGVPVKKEG